MSQWMVRIVKCILKSNYFIDPIYNVVERRISYARSL